MVTDVRTQNMCNACYADTAADQLDFWKKRMTGSFGVSVKALMDCTSGCRGGLMHDVYLQFESVGVCVAGTDFTVSEFVVLTDLEGDEVESNIASAVFNYGPVPIGIDSSGSRFITYESGIIRPNECNKEPNHAVTVVGYTPEYWIIRNSWGPEWGEGGYGKIERGSNTCGIDSYASFITSVAPV
jgi:hypothetical protein